MILMTCALALAAPPEGAWEVVAHLRGRRERPLAEAECAWERTTLRWVGESALALRHDRVCDDRAGWTARWSEVEVPVRWVEPERYVVEQGASVSVDLSVQFAVVVGAVRGSASRSWRVTAEVAGDDARLRRNADRLELRGGERRGLVLAPTTAEPDWHAVVESLGAQ